MINDKKGHLMGDYILKAIAKTINASIRPIDLLTRWGGDEFIILMEASVSEAAGLAERIRQSCSHLSTEKTNKIEQEITISIGISEYQERDSLDTLIDRADKALYTSKKKGKNCFTIADEGLNETIK